MGRPGALDQDKQFAIRAGQNLGDVLLRSWQGQASPAEKVYLAAWEIPKVTRLEALGVHCVLGANAVDELKLLLDRTAT